MDSEQKIQNCVSFEWQTYTHTHTHTSACGPQLQRILSINPQTICTSMNLSSFPPATQTLVQRLHKQNLYSGSSESYVWAQKHGLSTCCDGLDKSHCWVHKSTAATSSETPMCCNALRRSTSHLVATQFQWNFGRESNIPHQVFIFPSCFASVSTTIEL